MVAEPTKHAPQPSRADAAAARPRRWDRVRALVARPATWTRRRWVRVTGVVVAGVLLLTVLVVLPWRWVDPPTTSFILIYRASHRGHAPVVGRWVPWKRISPHLPIAVVASEDQKFPHHHGFDFQSIRESLDDPAGPRRGASTISQQLVKNLFLWPGHSWTRKGLEAYLTVFLEALWPKRRILEVYLNVVEFGPGVFGVGAASRTLFHEAPGQLNAYEAALLAAVLPSPRRMSAAEPSAYVTERAFWIMDQVQQLGGPVYLSDM